MASLKVHPAALRHHDCVNAPDWHHDCVNTRCSAASMGMSTLDHHAQSSVSSQLSAAALGTVTCDS